MYHPLIETLLQGGEETIITLSFLLSIPLIMTVINIFRYLIGLRTISIYATIATIFLFYSLGSTLTFNNKPDLFLGISYGTLLIFSSYAAIFISYLLTKKIQLHYYPKISLILISSTIAIFIVMAIARKLSDQLLVQINPLNVVLLIIISEQLLKVHIKSGIKKTFQIIIRSILITSICLTIIANESLQNILLNYPWVIILLIPINLFIGKFTGLRLTEYFRFYDLLIDPKNEDDNLSNTEE
ncbi:hypothetical protein GF362_01830 [Candidatus Dojkabacteria bacterium]|nr:hypothetical protein [Candidatus Dojkabacteria bacterium]